MQHVLVTVFGISFIFLMTSLGSFVVYFCKNGVSQKANTLFLGFASGVMLAASVWSLLLPAIGQAETLLRDWAFAPVSVSFLLGCLFLTFLHAFIQRHSKEGGNTLVNRSLRLFLAVTLHNIPEGLAVGFAFGSALGGDSGTLFSALALAIGIGIQNFPEGAAISLPLYLQTNDKRKAVGYGIFSGIVEPLFAILGYFLASFLQWLQPWLLAMSAGAMIFVVVDDLLPEIKSSPLSLGTWSVTIGFLLMMILDVALG